MRIYEELELREVFADIYSYIFNAFWDSDIAYIWAKYTRENLKIIDSYFRAPELY